MGTRERGRPGSKVDMIGTTVLLGVKELVHSSSIPRTHICCMTVLCVNVLPPVHALLYCPSTTHLPCRSPPADIPYVFLHVSLVLSCAQQSVSSVTVAHPQQLMYLGIAGVVDQLLTTGQNS
jgi:hypothetical protein